MQQELEQQRGLEISRGSRWEDFKDTPDYAADAEELHQIGEVLATIAGEIGELLKKSTTMLVGLGEKVFARAFASSGSPSSSASRSTTIVLGRRCSAGGIPPVPYMSFSSAAAGPNRQAGPRAVIDPGLGVEQTLHNLRVAVEDDRFDQAWAWERQKWRGAA